MTGLPLGIRRVVDLSSPLSTETVVYPGSLSFSLFTRSRIDVHGRRTAELRLTTHTGTHVDAAAHVFADGEGIDQVALDRLIGWARVFKLKEARSVGRFYSIDDLEGDLERAKDIEILLVAVAGSLDGNFPGNECEYPVPDRSVLEWVLRAKVKIFGTDAISIDPVGSRSMENHRLLLGKGILVAEALTNLSDLPTDPFVLVCAPLRIVDGDGAPCRAFALLV